MTRHDYIAALLLLLRLFEGTLQRDTDTRDHNYMTLVETLEKFLPTEIGDGDITPIRSISQGYLSRIQRLFLTPAATRWTRQTDLCREWVMVLLTTTQEN